MKRLVLVRHGESVWNAAGRIQGQQCAGLSERGLAQAAHVGAMLGETYPAARVVVSDLLRCQQTAQPLIDALPGQPVTDPRLRERHFGAWEGLTRAEAEAGDPDRWQRWRRREGDALDEIGGESDPVFLARIAPVLRELLTSTADDGVTVAVTHGGPIWHGTHELLGLAPGTLGTVHNASVTELITWDAQQIALDRWNETGHLPIELRLGWRPAVRA